jgi:hypothetical protein
MFFALATTALAIYMLELEYSNTLQAPIISWLLATVLGIPLSIALHLRLETAEVPTSWKVSLFAVLVAVIAGYGIWLPVTRMGLTQNVFLQWGLLFLASHILVSLSVHVKGMTDRRFWAFNMHTLMRFVLGVLFTAALNIGVILALLASDFLFNLDLDETIYFKVTFINHGLLMTAIIVAGIPNLKEPMEWEDTVPKALRLFCLYVLLPLAFIYLAILLLYSGKVIVEWTLPQGIVGSMILYYAIVGYATHVLTLPFQDEDSKSTMWFGKFFRYTMPVVLILFWVAIGLRVDSYGLTILRGLVIYLGVWLTAISLWALFTKGRPIAVIPASLAAVLFLGAVGPVSISSMSRISQVKELSSLIAPAPGESDADKIKNTADLDSTSISRIHSSIYYLSNTHGVASLEPFIGESIASLKERYERDTTVEYTSNWEFSTRLIEEWNIPSSWNVAENAYTSFNSSGQIVRTDISGYDHYVALQYFPNISDGDSIPIFDEADLSVYLETGTGLLVWRNDLGETVKLDVIGHLKSLPYNMGRGYVDLDETNAIISDSIGGKMKMLVESAMLHSANDTLKLQSLQGKIFIKSE